MERKLSCAIVDDDSAIHALIKGFLRGSTKAEVNYCFEKCSEFLEQMDNFSFDLVLLDCLFPNDRKDGVDVAIKLKEIGKHFIFISAKHRSFVEACRTVGALDAMPKPLTKKRFVEGIETAFNVVIGTKAKHKVHALFHVKEFKNEISINIQDILYVRTDYSDPRNKLVRMKNNIGYTFIHCSFDELLELSTEFAMANKSEMVSYDIVEGMNGECVFLKQSENNKIPKSIPLSPIYKSNFKYEFH